MEHELVITTGIFFYPPFQVPFQTFTVNSFYAPEDNKCFYSLWMEFFKFSSLNINLKVMVYFWIVLKSVNHVNTGKVPLHFINLPIIEVRAWFCLCSGVIKDGETLSRYESGSYSPRSVNAGMVHRHKSTVSVLLIIDCISDYIWDTRVLFGCLEWGIEKPILHASPSIHGKNTCAGLGAWMTVGVTRSQQEPESGWSFSEADG